MDNSLRLTDAPCKSWKTARSHIFESAEVHCSLQRYKHCPVHMFFASMAGEAEITACSVCGIEKPSSSEEASAEQTSVTYIPIARIIRSMIEKEGKFEAL